MDSVVQRLLLNSIIISDDATSAVLKPEQKLDLPIYSSLKKIRRGFCCCDTIKNTDDSFRII